jgi:outer membrane protein assembly factor BamB
VFERDGVVYSASNDNTVKAADASDGSSIWSHSLHSDLVNSVFDRNGVVYSASSDNTVKAAVSVPSQYISNNGDWVFSNRIESQLEGGQLG